MKTLGVRPWWSRATLASLREGKKWQILHVGEVSVTPRAGLPNSSPPASSRLRSPSWKLSKEISGFTLRYPRRKEGTGNGAGGHLEEEGTSGREKGCPGERRGETWTEVCTVG